MTLRVVTAATETLVELDLVKRHLAVDVADEDALLSAYLAAATRLLEAATQRRFLTQTLDWHLGDWPADFRLPVAPVAEEGITSISYRDVNGAGATLTAGTDYVAGVELDTLRIRRAEGFTWPLLDPDAAAPVVVRFAVGEAAADVAENVKVAALMLVALMYENRGEGAAPALDPSKLPPAVEALIAPERWG